MGYTLPKYFFLKYLTNIFPGEARVIRKKWSRKISTLLATVLLLCGTFAWADEEDQSGNPAPTPAEKTSSKSLNDRVKDLESRLDSADQKFKQIREDQIRLHFNLYGDAEYRVSGLSNSFPQQDGFYIGQTDLHIMAQYGEHLGAMVENVVEFDGQNPSNDLERVMAYYSF